MALTLLITVVAVTPGVSGAASTVPPETYTASVCSAVATFEAHASAAEAALASAADAFQAQPTASTAGQLRDALVTFLQATRADAADAGAALRSAGVPDVSGGARFARAAIAQLAGFSKDVGAIIGQAKKIDTSSSAKFSRSFQKVTNALQSASDDAKKNARKEPAFKHADRALRPFVTYITTDAKSCPSS